MFEESNIIRNKKAFLLRYSNYVSSWIKCENQSSKLSEYNNNKFYPNAKETFFSAHL